MLVEKMDVSIVLCCVCVCVCAPAWVSQAIVPENLIQTQDILQTFMQQWSDKQFTVIPKKAQVFVFPLKNMKYLNFFLGQCSYM